MKNAKFSLLYCTIDNFKLIHNLITIITITTTCILDNWVAGS